MSLSQAPLQIGGTTVVGAAVVRSGFVGASQLALTGAAAIKTMAVLGVGLIGTGSVLVRRGRGTQLSGGHPLGHPGQHRPSPSGCGGDT